MPVNDLLHDGQPKAVSFYGRIASFVYFVKRLENVSPFFFRNPDSVIGNGNDALIAFLDSRDLNRAVYRCEFDAIAQQIDSHLAELVLVCFYHERLQMKVEVDLFGFPVWSKRNHDLANLLVETIRLGAQRHVLLLQLG